MLSCPMPFIKFKAENKALICREIISTANKLGISVHHLMSQYILHEIQIYVDRIT